ncbi:hypothetical protein [Prevotella sp. OH937_COT-195]|uniref:hypothetical protein n=1 Tax=Prevotella sp. OH937_COT-195 TaxID=2491051 RepID=UPI0013159C13|nr:hypothetical protein [Prevotella sp. OH937_COT-195]
MEYYEGKWCISANELVDGGIVSKANYQNWTNRNIVDVARRGGGASGNYALIVVDSLPGKYKKKVKELYPDGAQTHLRLWVMENYETDQEAVAFFHDREKTGVDLTKYPEKIREYVTNASVLNCCIKLYDRASTARKLMGEKYNWDWMADAIEALRKELGHTLPTSTLRFRKKVNEYRREGYGCLVSGKFGNQSARKVDYKAEQLILGLAVLPNKPYNTNIAEMYNMFVCGELDVYDPKTGELMNPDDFVDKKTGEPLELSESTINNYLNKPKNRVLVEHALSSRTTFMHEQMPHMHRHAPEFSLSKISFDDRDLPRKLKDTKARPKAYYAYDVMSQCVVGFAYNRNKNVDLVVECFRSMFRLLERRGWNCPAQVEVENHLMSQWKDSFLKAGVLFPFVRFCAPQNSQEKYAEPMNGAKKRSIEHRNHLGIGRFYAKDRHYRTEARKVFDELNDTYEDKQYYSWDELIADDMMDVMEFNNSLHPNQKKYPGMTRWQVLEANLNPTLQPLDKSVLARFIGEHVETSIRRNSYCRVAYTDWWLSDVGVLEKLAPNNWKVDAYYLTDEEGVVKNIYIYQNDMLIDELQNVGTFNTADCEQTEADKAVFVEQQKKIAGFNKWVTDNAIERLGVMKASLSPKSEDEDVEVLELKSKEEPPSMSLPPASASSHALADI